MEFFEFLFLNPSTEPKEYCDHFYMTVHNVKNLQKIKLKIFFQILYPRWVKFAPACQNCPIRDGARIHTIKHLPTFTNNSPLYRTHPCPTSTSDIGTNNLWNYLWILIDMYSCAAKCIRLQPLLYCCLLFN